MNPAEQTIRERIMDLLKWRPLIRDMQISDALDIAPQTVTAELEAAMRNGEIEGQPIPGPQGRAATGYRIKAGGLNWRAPSSSSSQPAADAPPTTPPVSAPQSGPERETKVDKAIAYLQENGTANSDELKMAMGLKEKDSPSQYLGAAVKNGRIVRAGKDWRLGDGTTTQRTKPAPNKQKLSKPSTVAKPPRSVTPLHIPQDAVHSSMSIGGMQVILWKRGSLMLSANDNTVELAPAQAKALQAFVGLMEA